MNQNEALKEEIIRISQVNPLKCMRCGKCSGTCPSYDEMEYHPHQFVYMVETGELASSIDYQTGGRPSIRYSYTGQTSEP